MDGSVTLAALGSAALHASWSAMAYRFKDQAVGFAMMAWVSIAFGLTLVAVSASPARSSWAWIAGSVLVHVVYTVALTKANALAQFSQVYPISRGTAPVLVASVALVGIGDRLTGQQVVAVGTIVAGLLLLSSVGPVGPVGPVGAGTVRSRAVLVAVLVSVLIATYTVIDGLGVRRSGSVLGYTGYLSLGQGVLTVCVLQSRRGFRRRLTQDRRLWRWAVVGGVMASSGYATMIWAQQHGSLAVVAALRETSVLFATAIGVVIFREGAAPRRLLAASLVVAGIAVLQLA